MYLLVLWVMGTRSVIGRAILDADGTYDGQFKGVYHHWDGYPTGLGAHLFSLLKGKYKDNLSKMLTWVIDSHSAGWSTIMVSATTKKPECFCHPKRDRSPEPKGNWFTNENVEGDIEWLYIFDEAKRLLYVTAPRTPPLRGWRALAHILLVPRQAFRRFARSNEGLEAKRKGQLRQ